MRGGAAHQGAAPCSKAQLVQTAFIAMRRVLKAQLALYTLSLVKLYAQSAK
jgi:hypothetical protein